MAWRQVFNQSASSEEERSATWRESLYRMYRNSSGVASALVYGCKHDASTFEVLLKDMCNMARLVRREESGI